LKGYSQKIKDESLQEWERIRWQTFYLINIQIDKKHRLKKLTDLIRFEHEVVESKMPDMNKIKQLEELIRKSERK